METKDGVTDLDFVTVVEFVGSHTLPVDLRAIRRL
jgi:hypothetical protein